VFTSLRACVRACWAWSDYARMLGMVPHMPSHLIPRSITIYDKAHESVAQWPVAQLEERLKVTYCALPVCGHKYIEELMFSGFGIGETDVEFRCAQWLSRELLLQLLFCSPLSHTHTHTRQEEVYEGH